MQQRKNKIQECDGNTCGFRKGEQRETKSLIFKDERKRKRKFAVS